MHKMNQSTQKSTYCMRYKEIAKQKDRVYYAKNKEKIKVSQRVKYKNMSTEDKKKLVEK